MRIKTVLQRMPLGNLQFRLSLDDRNSWRRGFEFRLRHGCVAHLLTSHYQRLLRVTA